jgi:parallel beta-helix repeat protein
MWTFVIKLYNGEYMLKKSLLGKCFAFGIILLFVGTSIIPSFAQNNEQKPSLPAPSGNWLYVGGSGPGNYTSIQDAINDSNTGDTVYVYDDASPYYENVVVQKSITLIGEDKISTEINGSSLDDSLDTVNVTGDHVAISGFRVTNNIGYYYQGAIKVMGDYVSLSDCIISGNEWIGIYLVGASYCQIVDCVLYENLVAIDLVRSRNNVIQNCVCINNSDAITLFQSSDNNQIINCTCSGNHFESIHIQQSSGNQITGCVCQNGYDGISLAYAPNTRMRNNTMMNNYANFGIGSSSVSDFYCDIDTSNTINGKPMYYLIEQDNLLFDETMQIGFLGLVSCQNITVKNCDFTNNFEGMLVVGTSDSYIDNCSFMNNDGHGMYILSSVGNTVKNCIFRNSFWDGIFLYDSSDNTLENCSCYGSLAGVSLYYCTNNTIRGLTIKQCSVGVSFDSSGNNLLKNNEMFNCGLKVTGSSPAEYINDVDTSNTVNGKPLYYCINETNRTIPSDAGAVILISCNDCVVSNLNLSDASVGIKLVYSSTNTITNNILSANSVVAIDLDGSDNDDNLIRDNVLKGNNYGIDVDSSSGNIIQGNMLSDNGLGISFDSSMENTIVGNTVQGGSYGIYFDYSSLNTLADNTIHNTSIFGLYFLSSSENDLTTNKMINCSLMVYGNSLAEYINDVDSSNTVNGKPVYYYLHQTGIVAPQDAGEILLIDSSRCTIKNLNLNRGTMGIILAYSSNNMIVGNTLNSQSMIAIDLGHVGNTDNTVQGNMIQDSGYGIDIEISEGNTVIKNKIVSNGYGIFLYNAVNTTIRRNTISKNNYGISVIDALGSKIRFNNIFWNYVYGLSAEACSVAARWNWWGAAKGPNVQGDGNGDRLSDIKNGDIAYIPWLPLPVLFTGRIQFFKPNSNQQNFVDRTFITQGKAFFEAPHIISDEMAMFGMKNVRIEKELAILPKVSMEQNFDTRFL